MALRSSAQRSGLFLSVARRRQVLDRGHPHVLLREVERRSSPPTGDADISAAPKFYFRGRQRPILLVWRELVFRSSGDRSDLPLAADRVCWKPGGVFHFPLVRPDVGLGN